MNKAYIHTLLLPLATAIALAGCATPSSSNKSSDQSVIENVRGLKEAKKTSSTPKFTGRWDEGSDATGEPQIIISLSEQRARFYKGETLVGEAPISTGREGYETKPGEYKVLGKEPNHVSNLYGEFVNANGRIVGYGTPKDTPPPGTRYEPSPMPNYLRISYDGTGLHAGFLPGYPASHGCIRLPAAMSKKFYDNMPLNGKVVITP